MGASRHRTRQSTPTVATRSTPTSQVTCGIVPGRCGARLGRWGCGRARRCAPQVHCPCRARERRKAHPPPTTTNARALRPRAFGRVTFTEGYEERGAARARAARRRGRSQSPCPCRPLLSSVLVSATVDPTSRAQVDFAPTGDVAARSGTTSREGERARVSARSPVRSPVTLSLSSPTATTSPPPPPHHHHQRARAPSSRLWARFPHGAARRARWRECAGRRASGWCSLCGGRCVFSETHRAHTQLLCFCEKTPPYRA